MKKRTKTVKAWAILTDGFILRASAEKGNIKSLFKDEIKAFKSNIVPCTITYELPSLPVKKKAR